MLMAFYSQCCPYVCVRQELRTAVAHFFFSFFFSLYFSARDGLLSMHTTAPCFTPGSFLFTITISYCWKEQIRGRSGSAEADSFFLCTTRAQPVCD